MLAVIREGLCNGGIAINYLEAISFLKDNMNKIIGVALKDKLGGKEFEVKAKSVVCATGVWTKEITDMAGIKLNLRPQGISYYSSKRKTKSQCVRHRFSSMGWKTCFCISMGRGYSYRDN